MRRSASALLLLGALLGVSGCSSPLGYYAPTVETVSVSIRDKSNFLSACALRVYPGSLQGLESPGSNS